MCTSEVLQTSWHILLHVFLPCPTHYQSASRVHNAVLTTSPTRLSDRPNDVHSPSLLSSASIQNVQYHYSFYLNPVVLTDKHLLLSWEAYWLAADKSLAKLENC